MNEFPRVSDQYLQLNLEAAEKRWATDKDVHAYAEVCIYRELQQRRAITRDAQSRLEGLLESLWGAATITKGGAP